MKIFNGIILCVLATGCLGGNSGGVEDIVHSDAQCPTNLSGTYESKVEGEDFSISKTVIFKKDESGVFVLNDGEVAENIKVNGKRHTFNYKSEDGRDLQASYTAKCSNSKIYLNVTSPEGSLKSEISLDENDNYISSNTYEVQGASESFSEKMTRVSTSESQASVNNCSFYGGEYTDADSGNSLVVSQNQETIEFSNENIPYPLSGEQVSNSYITAQAICSEEELRLSKVLDTGDIQIRQTTIVTKTSTGIKLVMIDEATGVETVRVFQKD